MRRAKSDPVVREYASLARRYDARWCAYVQASVENTLARLPIRDGQRLLDVGCGTGQLLAALHEKDASVELFGVDSSPEMLAEARSRLPGGCPLATARAEQLPFRDGAFDWVVSTSVFHYLRQPRVALDEFRRVLKPTGQLGLTDWCDDFLACKISDALLRIFSRSHFRTYTRSQCERLLRQSSFEAVAIDRYRISWVWGLMTARAEKRAV